MRTFNTVAFILFSFQSFNCNDAGTGPKTPPNNEDKVSISQGVWGNVWFWEGDFMPVIDDSPKGTITPISRQIFVYEATKFDSVETADGVFYDKILTKRIAVLHSDETGFFQIELPPGKFSFFVKEKDRYYANGNDGNGHILPATVTTGSVTKRQIDITYKATY